VPLFPPDLVQPFQSAAQRRDARELLEARARTLRSIEELAAKPATEWTESELAWFPHSVNGIPDPPPTRLIRWVSLFSEELEEVHRLAERPLLLGDVELRQALFLAARLLATVTDRAVADIDTLSING
jgi:hypothetical protein